MSKKQVRKVDIDKDMKAIKRKRRKKIAGKVFASVFVLLFALSIVGVSVFAYKTAESAWDNYVGIEAGVKFGELPSIIKGVMDADEEKIVTNSYTESDLTDFYSNIKNKMYLSQDYDLDILKIVSEVMGGESQGSQTGDVTLSTRGTYGYDHVYVYTFADGRVVESAEELSKEELDDLSVEDGEQPNGEGTTGTGNSALDDLLKEIEFDFSSLENYEGGKNVLEISDRQLAAFVDEMFAALPDYFPSVKDMEKQLGCNLVDTLEIKQIIISGDILKPESVGLKMTLNVKLRDMMSGIVDAKKLPAILKSVMPKNIYASATVYPCDRARGIQVALNAAGEAELDKVVRIADVIMKKSGAGKSLSDMLIDVNAKVVDVIEKAQSKIPLAFVASGSVDMYPIETLMNTMKIEVSEEAFLYMLRDIKLPTEQSLGFDVFTPEIKLRDTQEFIGEISSKYGIDNSDNKITAENTIADVMNFAQGQDVLNKVDLKAIDYSGEYDEKRLKVASTFQAMSNMLSTYVNSQQMLGDLKAEIVNMSYVPSKSLLNIDIKVDVAHMLGMNKDDAMSHLISQLIPQSIFVTAGICVDKNLDVATTVEINKAGVQNSQKHLETLMSIAKSFSMNVSSLDYSSLCQKVDDGIKQGLAKVEEQIGCALTFDERGAYLPSLYEVVSGNSLVNGDLAEGDHYFSPGEIRMLLKNLYTYSFDENADGYQPAENMEGFIDQLYDKYFISDSYRERLRTAMTNNTILDSFMSIGGENFDMSQVRLEDIYDPESGALVSRGLKSRFNVTDISSVGEDGVELDRIMAEITEKFNPVLSVEELGYLLGTQVNFVQNLSFMSDAKVVFAKNYNAGDSDYLELKIKGKGSISNANAASLLPEYLYIDVKVDLGKVTSDGLRSDMSVFYMDVNAVSYDRDGAAEGKDQELQLLLMLVDRINGKSSSSAPEGDQLPQEPQPSQTYSLDKIISDIEVKLNGKKDGAGNVIAGEEGFKDKIHNSVFTVTFVDGGGFRIDQTVYQVALNSIYGADARGIVKDGESVDDSIPSEIDFRNAICKVNNMPDAVEVNGKSISLTESNKLDAKNAVDEINEKYALNESSKLNADDLTAVLSDIGNKVSDYANAIDGAKLTSDFADGTKKTLENMRPEVLEGELLNFLENSVKITAEGYQDTQMLGLYIVDENDMTMVYKSKIKSSGGKYSALLPSDIAMLVNIDISKLVGEDVCTEININDLRHSEVSALDAVRVKIGGDQQAPGAGGLDQSNAQCSDSVKNTLKSLTDNMELTFRTDGDKGGRMVMDGIYEVAADKINAGAQSGVNAQGIKDTLESLFAGLDLHGYTGASKDITVTPLESQAADYNLCTDLGAGTVTGAIGDGNISAKIDANALRSNMGISSSDPNALRVAQSALVSAGESSFDALRKSLGYVDGQRERLNGGRNYYLLTLEAKMQAAIGASMTMLPESVYITVIVDMDSADNELQIVYNALSDEQIATLSKLMNANADGASSFTDPSNLDKVKTQILDTALISGTSLTLGRLFNAMSSSDGSVAAIPIGNVSGKNDGVVVGVGALNINVGLN